MSLYIRLCQILRTLMGHPLFYQIPLQELSQVTLKAKVFVILFLRESQYLFLIPLL